MDCWRDYFAKSGADIWTVIQKAIIVAAADCSHEFRLKRSDIAETLFARDLLSVPCRYGRLSGSIITNLTNQTLENEVRNDEEVAHPKQEFCVERERHGCSFGDADTFTDRMEEEALVLEDIYRIREAIKGPDQPENVLIDSLQRLEYLQITVESLKETQLGKHVNGLRKHSSKHVRNLAKRLVREWKGLVDEWMETAGEVAETFVSGCKEGTEPVELHKKDDGLALPLLNEGSLLAAQTSSLDVSQLFSFIDDIPGCGDVNNQAGDLTQVALSSCPSKCESRVAQADERKCDIETCMSYEDGEHRVPEETESTTRVAYEGLDKSELDPEPHSRNLARQDAKNQKEVNKNVRFVSGKHNIGSGSQGKPAKEVTRLKASAPSGTSCLGRSVINHNIFKVAGHHHGLTSNLKPSDEKLSQKEDHEAEKLELAKRKLRQGYQHVENAKKQHVVQILDLPHFPKEGPNPAKPNLLSKNRSGSRSWQWTQNGK